MNLEHKHSERMKTQVTSSSWVSSSFPDPSKDDISLPNISTVSCSAFGSFNDRGVLQSLDLGFHLLPRGSGDLQPVPISRRWVTSLLMCVL